MSGLEMLYETSLETHQEDMDGVDKCIILFYKDDCEPCHELAEKLALLNVDEVPCMKSNLEMHPEFAMECRVVHPSTLIMFEDGRRTKKRFAAHYTMEQVKEWADV